MKFVSPRVYNLASTQLNQDDVAKMLKDLGVPDWRTDTDDDGQILIEIAGKFCYQSFSLDLNANLKTIRSEDNAGYIANVVGSGHGSVLEHVQETFALLDVSRIVTHETVRHRIAGYSQESLRFVRLTELKVYFPEVFQEAFLRKIQDHLVRKGRLDEGSLYNNPKEFEEFLRRKFVSVFSALENVQRELAEVLHLDSLDGFSDKKKLTSAMRRLAPLGLATGIIMSANLRTWRHVVEARTSRHAEEEIRLAFGLVYRLLKAKHPNVFADAQEHEVEGHTEVVFKTHKV